jgi:hypothetical protein
MQPLAHEERERAIFEVLLEELLSIARVIGLTYLLGATGDPWPLRTCPTSSMPRRPSSSKSDGSGSPPLRERSTCSSSARALDEIAQSFPIGRGDRPRGKETASEREPAMSEANSRRGAGGVPPVRSCGGGGWG